MYVYFSLIYTYFANQAVTLPSNVIKQYTKLQETSNISSIYHHFGTIFYLVILFYDSKRLVKLQKVSMDIVVFTTVLLFLKIGENLRFLHTV